MKPKEKYDFNTGKKIGKRKILGYKYLGKGEIGRIRTTKIDGETAYYLEDFGIGIRRSPYSFDKFKFKTAEVWEEDIDWTTDWVEKQKPKEEVKVNTKIDMPKGDRFMRHNEIRITKKDYLSFFTINESELIKQLQLKKGDKLKVTIKKLSSKTQKEKGK